MPISMKRNSKRTSGNSFTSLGAKNMDIGAASQPLLTKVNLRLRRWLHLTIIPRARMGSESIAHEAKGRMGYWLRGHEGERNNCFSKIRLVGQKYRE